MKKGLPSKALHCPSFSNMFLEIALNNLSIDI